MTIGELFREIAREVGLGTDEAADKLADTYTPEIVREEISQEEADLLKPELMKIAREIRSMPRDEVKSILAKHNAMN